MYDLSKCKLLAVDDNEFNRDLLLKALQCDYDIKVIGSSEKAVEMVESYQPDIILLDIMMPGIDGYGVCKLLKENKNTKSIPVIFITAKSEVEDETKGLELGAVDYITKPITLSILKARIRTHLNLKLAREELQKQNEELQEASRLREDVERISRHDLKTPLNSVIAMPDLIMMNDNLTENQIELLKNIRESGYTMLHMINFSLDLFKMERGLYQFLPVKVNLIQVINKILVEYQEITSSRGLNLSVSLQGKPVGNKDEFMVQGENLLCYSMMANLIKNAIEASLEGGLITISLEKNDWAEIKIHNQGAVPKAIREKFFEKYVTSGKKNGTGLGTYSAKLIATTLGGDIGIETSDEEGTEITVQLKH